MHEQRQRRRARGVFRLGFRSMTEHRQIEHRMTPFGHRNKFQQDLYRQKAGSSRPGHTHAVPDGLVLASQRAFAAPSAGPSRQENPRRRQRFDHRPATRSRPGRHDPSVSQGSLPQSAPAWDSPAVASAAGRRARHAGRHRSGRSGRSFQRRVWLPNRGAPAR